MEELKGWQRQYLRSLAHHIKPVVQVGKHGVSPELVQTIEKALDDHELIKIKFINFKDEKEELSDEIRDKTSSMIVGKIGNMLILYKENKDPEKRKIRIPKEKK